jgi:hypothetical protein
LTRSHHNISPTIHIADDDGVTLFKTCTAEVFRPASKDENRSFQVFETRKDSAVHVSLSSSSLVKQPGAQNPIPHSMVGATQILIRRQITTDCLSVVDSLIKMRSFTGTKTCRGRGPKQRRAQWPGYRPARSGLSTAIVNKSSHRADFSRREDTAFLGDFAPYLSHNPATF